MKKSPKAVGKFLEEKLNSHDVLMLQDKVYPSFVTFYLGNDVKGSWWGHPQAKFLYNGIMYLEHELGYESVKFLSGKVTYFSNRAKPYFSALVKRERDWQVNTLKANELKVLELIKKKKLSLDQQKSSKKEIEKLEKKLLVWCKDQHTDSGMHRKLIFPIQKHPYFVKPSSRYDEAITFFERIIQKNSKDSKVKLPWK